MTKYSIYNRAGVNFGIYSAPTPNEAILAMHRDAGYGPDVVWLEGDAWRFRSQDDRALIGASWSAEEYDAETIARDCLADDWNRDFLLLDAEDLASELELVRRRQADHVRHTAPPSILAYALPSEEEADVMVHYDRLLVKRLEEALRDAA
jgi:hypothetical protein